MANINLITSKEESNSLGTGIGALFALLLVVALIYVGLLFYGNKLVDDANKSAKEYESKLNNFIAGDAKRVLDFQNRLSISKVLLAQERDSGKDIGKVEDAMITGVNLGSYKYDDASKSITLDCYADNYETVAKQILSFKSYDYFSSVFAGETKFDTKSNKISFPVVLTIK